MASEIKANKISPATGTAFTIGDSGDTFTVPSGATLAVASGATISNSGTASGFGVSNDVVFVKRSADQSLSANTTTKVQFDSEIYDSNNWFDSTTNYRFQPDEAGNYLCFANIALSNAYYANQPFNIFFYKNGSEFLGTTTNHRYDETMMDTFSGIINLNGSTDYVEVYARFSQSVSIESSSNNTTSGTSTTAYFVRLT